MMQKNLSVLVCGAGPTGLMTACQLALHNIPFRIIDKSAIATSESRALVLHARSLEIFKQMGIADDILGLGEVCRGVTWTFNGKEVVHIDIEGENLTEFPYVFCLEQSKTEETLINFLKKRGVSVERQVELIDYSQTEAGIFAQLKKANGSIENITANYLIGADGAHSVVRKKMNLHLEGSTYQQTLFVIDCQVKANFRPNEIYLSVSRLGLIGFFPMVQSRANVCESAHRYRVLGVLPAADKDRVVTFEEIQQNFSERIAMPGEIFDVAWMSTYHAHHRHAPTFRDKRCFIVGDSAHIHSPVGGQGMNTGLQDAYNLVWKLASVIRNDACDALLDSFNIERMAVAKDLVVSTDKVFSMVASESWKVKNFRLHVLPHLLRLFSFFIVRFKPLAKKVFSIISQINIRYSKSFLSENASFGSFVKHAPQPGDRFPLIMFQEEGMRKNIQDLLAGVTFHCFVFSEKNSDEMQKLLVCLDSKKALITSHVIAYNPGTANVYKTLGLKNGYYLVRPDMYIACRSTILNIEPLERYLANFYKKSEKSC